MQERLEQILESCRKYTWEGEVADYIPELAKANREEIGIYVATDHGEFFAGDWEKQFTIQSIVKTIFLMLAAQDNGIQYVKDHVGVEATGKPFNSVGKIPWRGIWQPISVFLPRESHGLQSLADYSPWGCKEPGTTDLLSMHTFLLHGRLLPFKLHNLYKIPYLKITHKLRRIK